MSWHYLEHNKHSWQNEVNNSSNTNSSNTKNSSSTILPNIPVGTVMLWPTSSGDIPNGWKICDGEGSTPNFDEGVFTSFEDESYGDESSSSKIEVLYIIKV